MPRGDREAPGGAWDPMDGRGGALPRERKDWVRPKQFNVPENVIEALASWDFWTQAHFPDRLADMITDDVLDQFALAGTPEECADSLRKLQRELPEVSGVRIYAVPPDGKPLSRAMSTWSRASVASRVS